MAPIPKNTTATLWVPKAVPKGRPNKIRSGNWIKPAPPPETLANKVAVKVPINRMV